ncbi:hypothetical protein D9615_004129 [Tricholomella constricta]|uniref:Protection of telomeres protein 1 n=1 Tax=Tricholomella constricta TaxID=117010 RepID=A0A8H5HD51_9AGAR|nr:hypothetical protein D9615_004129 [Tricholomella constricta]
MKRAAPAHEYPSKQIKLSEHPLFEKPSPERDPNTILEHGLSDNPGYIPCICFMTWRPTKKHRAIVETTGTALPKCRFEVEFTGACTEFFHEIELKARDEFLLSLRGARIVKLEKCSLPCSLPMKLIYEEGVVIKFLKRRGPCQTVDTWKLKEIANRDEDTWFLTPRERTGQADVIEEWVTELATASRPSTKTTPVLDSSISTPGRGHQTRPLLATSHSGSSVTAVQEEVNPGTLSRPPVIPTTVGQPTVKLSKKKMRELKKQERAALRSGVGILPESMSASTNTHPSPAALSTTVHRISQAIPSARVPEDGQQVPIRAQVAAPAFATGLKTSSGRYDPLKNALPVGALCNLIGVVVHASSPSRTRTGDLSCNVKLIDPSNTVVDNLNNFGSFQINCFTKQHPQWLPQPKFGEVLIMRDVKISNHQGNTMGIGYKDKMQWAIYCPTTGKVRRSDLGDVPESEGADQGFGYQFSPFFQPDEAVIRYCLKLADWWLDVEKQRKAIGEVHQVGGTNEGLSVHDQSQRKHKLISEAGPHVPPSGYFDCTVEVLHGHMNDNGVYSLYVTDYTVNEAITPVQAEWCPAGLADHVLKIEAWDAAVEVVQTMFVGEYYSIKNARMKFSQGGYLEGKLNEQKVRKLDVEEDSDVDRHFKALLERKSAWRETNVVKDEGDDVFEYSTIDLASEGKHFNCVVEVLHAVYDGDGTSCIYVTDYTSRDELATTNAHGSWGDGLQGRILRIALFNNQAEMTKSVQAGSFYTIKKLRMKKSTTALQFQGQLGGMERLIFLLNPRSDDDKLNDLKQRKEEWKYSRETPKAITKVQSPQSGSEPALRGKTIAELEADLKCPNKSRITARIVDFRPWNLRDAVVIHCTKCNQDLPDFQKACFKCHDTDHEYVRYLYQMYLLLQDEDGKQLYVSLHDESSVFNDLKRTDINEDRSGFQAFSNRLSKMLGNLPEIHNGPFPKEKPPTIAPDTPMLSLIVDSWEVEGKRAYCLAECEDLLAR